MVNRLQDIRELLGEVEQNIRFFERQSNVARTDEDLQHLAKVKVKSSLEHLRSCLDYAAHDIYEHVLGRISKDEKIYFPYGKSKDDFYKNLKRNLKGLNSSILELVEGMQPHVCGDDWLVQLCDHTNINKHRILQDQERINSEEAATKLGNIVHIEDSGSVRIGKLLVDGVLMNPGGELLLSNERTVHEISDDVQGLIEVTRKYGWVKYRFKDSGTDVLELVRKAHTEIGSFVQLLYKEMGYL